MHGRAHVSYGRLRLMYGEAAHRCRRSMRGFSPGTGGQRSSSGVCSTTFWSQYVMEGWRERAASMASTVAVLLFTASCAPTTQSTLHMLFHMPCLNRMTHHRCYTSQAGLLRHKLSFSWATPDGQALWTSSAVMDFPVALMICDKVTCQQSCNCEAEIRRLADYHLCGRKQATELLLSYADLQTMST